MVMVLRVPVSPKWDGGLLQVSHVMLTDRGMVIRVIVLFSRQLFYLLLLCCRTTRSKDIELLVLRQEVAILRRQVNRPQVKPEERMVFAVLQRLRPVWEGNSSLVTCAPGPGRRWGQIPSDAGIESSFGGSGLSPIG